MPVYWKILSKRFLFHTLLFSLFFLGIILFFKLSRFAKYFVAGVDLKDLSLLLAAFLYKCTPFGVAITSLGAAAITCSLAKKNQAIKATSALGISPHTLFFPMLVIAAFLSLGNGYLYFALGPKIHSALGSALKTKAEKLDISSLISTQNKGNLFVSLGGEDGSDFLMIQDGPSFSWTLCDHVFEDSDALYLDQSHFFKIKEEKNSPPSIVLLEDEQTTIPKSSLLQYFEPVVVKNPPVHYSFQQIVYLSLYLLFPISFTMLGISLSLRIYPVLSIGIFLFSIISFALATLHTSHLPAILSATACTLCICLYFLTLRSYTKGAR